MGRVGSELAQQANPQSTRAFGGPRDRGVVHGDNSETLRVRVVLDAERVRATSRGGDPRTRKKINPARRPLAGIWGEWELNPQGVSTGGF
jgi:hypothetical protein